MTQTMHSPARISSGLFLEWLANLPLLAGGILMSALPAIALRPHVFGFFLGGHLIWAGLGVARKSATLAVLNLGLLLLDAYAIHMRLMS